MKYTEKIGVSIPAWLVERKIIMFYLIIDGCWNKRELSEAIQTAPDAQFYDLVSKHMTAYLRDGTMPPAEIAPAIMNLVDDQMSGRSMTLRAGDYISLQNYLRKSK